MNQQRLMNKKEKIKQKRVALRQQVREAEQQFFLELNKTKKNALELSENAILVAGSVVMGFVLIQVWQSRKGIDRTTRRKTGRLALSGFSIRGRIYKRFLQYLSLFILNIARRKLINFLLENGEKAIDNTEGTVQEQE